MQTSHSSLGFGLIQLPNSDMAEVIITNTGNLPLEFTGNGLGVNNDAEYRHESTD